MTKPAILERYSEDVLRVESELEALVHSDVELVCQVGMHTLKAGGKRLRPAIVSLAARATCRPFDQSRADRLGACLELVHMATLIHDDVIDHAESRRGVATAAAVFGNTASILTGDVLLARAMAILADDGDIAIIRTVSQAVVELSEGEVLELSTRGDYELSEADHLRILQMKTASFIRCCCEVGALVAGAGPDEIRALSNYGEKLGLSFQIVDDLLDYRGDRTETGKLQATDYREGCATLPLIYLREHLSNEEDLLVRRKFGNGVTDDEIGAIVRWMAERGSFARSERSAAEFAREAVDALIALPDGQHKDALASIATYVVDRKA